MSTKVIMPQMGESIAEGTITKWLKKVGEQVVRDEPLFEISTDKVDAEIPSPASGTLLKILAAEGETVEVNLEVALIGESGQQPEASGPPEAPARKAAPASTTSAGNSGASVPARSTPASTTHPPLPSRDAPAHAPQESPVRSSPVVRRMAAEHHIDLTRIQGSGISGRVTKKDILAHLEGLTTAAGSPAGTTAATPAGPFDSSGERREKMTVMRQQIAQRMVEARRLAAHVHTVFDMDLTEIGKLRQKHKATWLAKYGLNLTWMPFIQRSLIDALTAFPLLNARLDGQEIVYHRDVNLGVAVALDWGLIVPVIHKAGDLSLLGLARATTDLAGRARRKKLKPEEVAGNTFSITNPGVFGGRFGTPIIPPPTVAILGIGSIEPRPVVRHDAIAIRTMCTFCLGFDHRLIDGAVADEFMSHFRKRLQEARFSGLD